MIGTETVSTPEILWAPAPDGLKLAKGGLQVFCASLELTDAQLANLGLTLSKDEHARASRFRFDKDRRRFIASRGTLRELLGRLLGVDADRLAFGLGARGKPLLAAPRIGHALHFNLAHADSLALYAVAWEHDVGIDIERIRSIGGAAAIAERFFSRSEFADWRSVSPQLRMEAFFNCWTRKEACLKATGDGISEGLAQVEVSLLPGHPARLIGMNGDSRADTSWSLHALKPAPAYVGAVAVKRSVQDQLTCWKW